MADSSSPGRPLRSVCVYCGSSETTKPEYHDLATRFGTALAQRGLRLVYGGGSIGLMGRCAKAAHAAGGEVLGILAVVDREEGGRATLEAAGWRVVALTTATRLGLKS